MRPQFYVLPIALILLNAVRAQEGPARVDLPPAQLAGEILGDRVSNPDKQGDWPAIAATQDGSLWGDLDRMER